MKDEKKSTMEEFSVYRLVEEVTNNEEPRFQEEPSDDEKRKEMAKALKNRMPME